MQQLRTELPWLQSETERGREVMRRPQGPADWFAYAYLAFAALVAITNIVVHMIGPW